MEYAKLYALLCGAIDEVIDPLEQIPLAVPYAQRLREALTQAEELYISGSECGAEPPHSTL